MTNKIILIGAGGHSKACIDVIIAEGKFKIAGLVAPEHGSSTELLDIPLIGKDEDLETLRNDYQYAFITVGQIKSPVVRTTLYHRLKALGFILPIIVSPRAYVSNSATLGEGTIVMHGAVVNADATIGNNCIINSQSLVEHDAVIKDHCHIAPGAIVNGGVVVGAKSFIGSGAVTRQYINIGSECIIGAGMYLSHDLGSGEVIRR